MSMSSSPLGPSRVGLALFVGILSAGLFSLSLSSSADVAPAPPPPPPVVAPAPPSDTSKPPIPEVTDPNAPPPAPPVKPAPPLVVEDTLPIEEMGGY